MNKDESKAQVTIVIYKRIVEGDLSKFTATSNISKTGGGARDLRFSPAREFFSIFKRIFRQDGAVLKGHFSWEHHPSTEVVVHPPTASRNNEVRIGRVHECFPQDIVPQDASDCVLLIVQDSSGKVSPYFTSSYSLSHDDWHPSIKGPILDGLYARRSRNTTAMGYIDIQNERQYTNGR